jgi:hypothetical protein
MVVPATTVFGGPLPETVSARLPYRENAFRCALITLATAFLLVYAGLLPAAYAYDNFLPLVSSMSVFSALLSVFLYIHSYRLVAGDTAGIDFEAEPERLLAHNSGRFFYDFFLGRALNPRVGSFDLKYFCELRPGLLLWLLMNLSLSAAAFSRFGTLPISNVLIVLFHSVYVLDALSVEAAILTTMDITTEGFGFMLAFGDHTWVPGIYTFQARYLANYRVDLSPHFSVFLVVLMLCGLWIFRASNSQKNAFRSDPNSPAVAHLKYITTARGTRLIVSSWWGLSRHINYCGDLLLGLSYCLPCGAQHFICYFYVLYFTILLVHRERRDDLACRAKYGHDWDRYCKLVPYRIFPYIY